MPVGLIAAIASLAAAGAGIGTSIYEAKQGGSSGPTAAEQAQLQAQQNLATQKAAFLTAQANPAPVVGTSGLTGPTTATATTPATNTTGGGGNGTANLLALVQALNGGSSSGPLSGGSGGNQGAQTPQVTDALTNLLLT